VGQVIAVYSDKNTRHLTVKINVFSLEFSTGLREMQPIPAAARPKAWVCGRSLAGIAGLNSTGAMGIYLF
jgi:hypothetical protein